MLFMFLMKYFFNFGRDDVWIEVFSYIRFGLIFIEIMFYLYMKELVFFFMLYGIILII